jgi:hypothetical protein
VWRYARPLPERIDPRTLPVDHAQALMFLHDTAQVLGRADLALGFVRRALAVLPPEARGNATSAGGVTRLRINALLAEAVSLNTLRLRAEAFSVCGYAESLAGFRDEPETWLRSFLEQRLVSMAGGSPARPTSSISGRSSSGSSPHLSAYLRTERPEATALPGISRPRQRGHARTGI